MKMKTLIAIGFVAAGISAASTASAATCADRTAVVDRLENNFGETLIANSFSASNNVLEVYSRPEAQSWTVLLTMPESHLTCLVAAGEGQTELQVFLDDI